MDAFDIEDFYNTPSFGRKVNIFCLPLVKGDFRRCHQVIRQVWDDLVDESEQVTMNVRQNEPPQRRWRPFPNPQDPIHDCVHLQHPHIVIPSQEENSSHCIKFHRFLRRFELAAQDLGFYNEGHTRHSEPIPWGANTRINHINYVANVISEDDFEVEIQLWWMDPNNYHILHTCGHGIPKAYCEHKTCMNHRHLLQGNRTSNSDHFTVHKLLAKCTRRRHKKKYHAVQKLYKKVEPQCNIF